MRTYNKDAILSSYRVHIEGRRNYWDLDWDRNNDSRIGDSSFENFEDCNDEHDCCKDKCDCDCDVEKGFDGKKDKLIIDVKVDCELDEQTHYILVLCQPAPPDGYNLPVFIRAHYCDTKKVETIRLIRGPEPWMSVGDLEYGQDLPKCRNRIPLYFTNGREFVDLRKRCCNL